jgi:3'-phosphoadenosine 5'-phosphosulfate sulfotransferase (PAPS reductase)/FAD synthetase
MMHLIDLAISKGAAIYASVSGGKDGQAMVRTMVNNGVPIAGMIHCDLGRSEWPQSLEMCQKQADEYRLTLHVLHRKDGKGLMEYMQRRMQKLAGTGKPFWPSAKSRYCTSDLKRGPSDHFFRNCGQNLIISAEGIRAQESKKRAKKQPLSIRPGVTSKYYAEAYTKSNGKKGYRHYSVEKCLEMYNPKHRLVLNWYPVFNMTTDEVWSTYGVNRFDLESYRRLYKQHGYVHHRWPFHPAYVMGNERVSCRFCVLGSLNDLRNAAREAPELLDEMIEMEEQGCATFKNNFSLKELRA